MSLATSVRRFRRLFARALVGASLSVVALAASFSSDAQTPAYTFVDLGVRGPQSGNNTWAYSINNAGQISGAAWTAYNVPRAFRITPVNVNGTLVWNQDTNGDGLNDLMTLLMLPSNRTTSVGVSINASGQVGGRASTPFTAVIWSATGAVTSVSKSSNSYATAINDASDLAGNFAQGNTNAPCLWKLESGKYTQVSIPTLSGFPQGYAEGINNSRQVVGRMYPSGGGAGAAFLWSQSGGTVRLLPPAGYGTTFAYAINSQGVVAGYSDFGGVNRPIVWQGGIATDMLNENPNFLSATLRGLNNAVPFQAVGNAQRSNGTGTAILWNGSTLVDLGDPSVTVGIPVGVTSLQANAINDNGYIVGSYGIGGAVRAFLLLPQ